MPRNALAPLYQHSQKPIIAIRSIYISPHRPARIMFIDPMGGVSGLPLAYSSPCKVSGRQMDIPAHRFIRSYAFTRSVQKPSHFSARAVPTKRGRRMAGCCSCGVDADACVIYCKLASILAQTARGTSLNTGRILARMQAMEKSMKQVVCSFPFSRWARGALPRPRLRVKFNIHRSHPCRPLHKVPRPTHLSRVEIQDIFHAQSPILSTLHAIGVSGNPE